MVACAWPAVPDAAAGTYDVWSCKDRDGKPLDADAWKLSIDGSVSDEAMLFENGCGTDGAVSVGLAHRGLGLAVGESVTSQLSFRAPADTHIVDYELQRRLTHAASGISTIAFAARRTEARDADPTPQGVEACPTTCGSLGQVAGPAAVQGPLETVALQVSASCPVAGLCLEALASGDTRAELHGARVTLEDASTPEEPAVSGSLADGGTAAGRATLAVAAEDAGGGVESLTLEIDGEPWRTVRAGDIDPDCREPYTDPRPCPPSVEHTFEIDSRTLEPGRHEASGAVVDAAGNRTGWGPVSFSVPAPPSEPDTDPIPPPRPDPPTPREPAPPPPPAQDSAAGNGRPAVERPRLRVSRRLVRGAPGRRVRVAGMLRTRSGRPIADAVLTVATVQLGVEAGRGRERTREVRTNARGRFAATVRARGARRVTVAFAPREGARSTARASAIVRARLALRAAPRPRALVKGRTLTLRGRLRGAGPSAHGALAHLQAIVNGRWTPVGRARVRRDGTYRWRYRFVHLSRDTIFSFRAVVERVPGWPWPTIRSPRVRVRVDVP